MEIIELKKTSELGDQGPEVCDKEYKERMAAIAVEMGEDPEKQKPNHRVNAYLESAGERIKDPSGSTKIDLLEHFTKLDELRSFDIIDEVHRACCVAEWPRISEVVTEHYVLPLLCKAWDLCKFEGKVEYEGSLFGVIIVARRNFDYAKSVRTKNQKLELRDVEEVFSHVWPLPSPDDSEN